MKILFVRSGNNGIDPISTNQGESLRLNGVHVDFFDLTEKGLVGYLKSIPRLRHKIIEIEPDIIHAHYSLCGYIAVLTMSNVPIICSLMGSDVIQNNKLSGLVLNLFISCFWASTIIKSKNLLPKFNRMNIHIIPNGVNMDRFQPLECKEAKNMLGWDLNKKFILFASNPVRPEKNFRLAEEIVAKVKTAGFNLEMISLMNINREQIPIYYNAADLLLLTSISEGSPNVIKEAMACNCPVVATAVGDIREVVKDTNMCKISDFDKNEMIEACIDILIRSDRSNGRSNIQHLDSNIIAQKLISIYIEVMKRI